MLTPALREKCGVFGIASTQTLNVGSLLYYGLYALQHRGQESCGMAVFNNDQLRIHKDMGLVNQVFAHPTLEGMDGQIGIGHVRYSTSGDSHFENAQPILVRSPQGSIVVAHNGNLIDIDRLREHFNPRDAQGYGENSDTHLMARCISELLHRPGYTFPQAAQEVLARCQGAFSVVMAMGDCLIAARDRHGLRPLCLGRTEEGHIVMASESCALDIVGARYERSLEPGELVIATRDGKLESLFLDQERQENFCIFELVYFARADSRFENKSVYAYRLALGRRLAEISPSVEADFVIPVPDSGKAAAVGYSEVSGVPYVEGLIKNRYVGRTFIEPTQELRKQGIRLKLNPLSDILAGKRVVVVDDSIVRGNTSRQIVKMLREAGAKEVHLRVSSAPVKHPCFYGIDMSTESELIANQLENVEAIQAWLGVDSLVYLTPEDMKQAVGLTSEPCMACFNNHYPAGKPTEAVLASV